MSVLKKINKLFADDSDEIVEEEFSYQENKLTEPIEKKVESAVRYNSRSKVNNIKMETNTVNKSDVKLIEPLVFADSKDILDEIKSNKVVILNLNKLDLQTGDRLLDYISGGMYALDAKLKTIGDEIYLCVPKGVSVSGEFSEGDYK